MYTHKGESFNIPALLRRLKAETADSYDSGVRNLGGMLARLIEAQQSALATSEAKLKEARELLEGSACSCFLEHRESGEHHKNVCNRCAFLARMDRESI
jgi:hypothetical protein